MKYNGTNQEPIEKRIIDTQYYKEWREDIFTNEKTISKKLKSILFKARTFKEAYLEIKSTSKKDQSHLIVKEFLNLFS